MFRQAKFVCDMIGASSSAVPARMGERHSSQNIVCINIKYS